MENEETTIKLNDEQETALDLMRSGRNIFLTGEAGTGKSTLVRAFIRHCGRSCIVLAPTGIAALNAGGTTIHSQLMLRPGLINPLALEPLNDGTRCQVLRAARVIVVDEISMVRSDLFCALDARLRQLAAGADRQRPFGGHQVVLVGDFMQLPPVLRDADERKFVDERLGGVFAFQTDLWQAARFRTVFLRTVHRQDGDARFRAVLNSLRHGDFAFAARVLNAHCVGGKAFPSPPVCLCTTNRDAQVINETERKKLTGESRTFSARVSGRFPESDLPADSVLELVVGARVMVTCNVRRDGDLVCVNGDRGTVTGFGTGGTPSVDVRLDDGRTVTLEPHAWEKYAYSHGISSGDGKTVLCRDVVGSFEQIPLRLAYAITIHKSQGLSLDAVDLRLGCGCFDHGQLYTALSRCRTLDGLKIDRPILPSDLIVDPAVVAFYSSCENHSTDGGAADEPWYEEAMQFYLRRLETGDGSKLPARTEQFEFDFSPRIHDHPDLSKLRDLHEKGAINKYDAPVLAPLVAKLLDGSGVKDEELATVRRLVAKYVGPTTGTAPTASSCAPL